MATSRLSIYVLENVSLSDEQIEAAALIWLELLHSKRYFNHDPVKPNHRNAFFTVESKELLLRQLEQQHPGWEDTFTAALVEFLTEHRSEPFVTLHCDTKPEDLLANFMEKIVEQLPILKHKDDLFPAKMLMTFDHTNNIVLNDKRMSATQYLYRYSQQTESSMLPAADKSCFARLGCPRLRPAMNNIAKLFRRAK